MRGFELVARGRHTARLAAEAFLDRNGYDLVKRGRTSLIPELPPADDPIWTRRSDMPGVELDLDAQIAFMERELAAYAAEFRTAMPGYKTWNGLYQGGDAEILYAMIRHLQPPRVLELGAGNSTTITAAAIEANRAEGRRDTEFVSVDPEPRLEDLSDDLPGLSRLERGDANDLPLERFKALGDGDVLFIDTSHVVKLGSEVNRLMLEVLPRLQPGVLVHVHDIHLPYEYPRLTFVHGDLMNEQYLLHALLAGDRGWEVVLALSALAREHNARFAAVVPTILERPPDLPHLPPWLPSAFWMRRRQSDA